MNAVEFIGLAVAYGFALVGAFLIRHGLALLAMSPTEIEMLRRDTEKRKRLAVFYRVRRLQDGSK